MKRVLMGLAAIAAMTCIPQTTSAQSAADLTLVHGIPGTTVDLSVDGTVVIDAFVPGSLANISSFAGQTLQNVTVTDDATGDIVIGPVASLVIPDSGSHSLVAHLDAAGVAVLSTFENNAEPTATGDARLTLRHTAEAPAVDLIIGDQRPIVDAINGQSAELELPAGSLTDAQLAPTGDVAIAEIATLDLAANTNTIVYAVGSVDDDTSRSSTSKWPPRRPPRSPVPPPPRSPVPPPPRSPVPPPRPAPCPRPSTPARRSAGPRPRRSSSWHSVDSCSPVAPWSPAAPSDPTCLDTGGHRGSEDSSDS